jgi:hypothetical protein
MNRGNRKNQELNNYKSRRTRDYDMGDNHIMNMFKDDFSDPLEDFFSFGFGGPSNSIAQQYNAMARFEQDFCSG